MKLNDTYPFAVPLQIIILDHHNGNISDFARSQGVSSSQVARWLKRDSYYIEGDVYCKISKRIKKECE